MSYYKKLLDGYTEGYIGFNTLAVLFQSCLGSVAAMLILQNGTDFWQIFQLFFNVMLCMLFNGSVLAQQKPKLVLNLLIASFMTNTMLIIINLIMINN